ncbi:MAG: CopD family protein [Gammaproteobacteria bacterium]|nr:CopD family protein [Gammaproteobacteria bacterium]
MHPLLIALHTLAAVIWVGGMFFAYMALRPAAGATLEPPQRLSLWHATFTRFFVWVWISIAVLLISGYGMVFGTFKGFANVGVHVHTMQALGILMMLLFAHLYFAPFKRLGRQVTAGAWPEAGRQLNQIRLIVAINLCLGIIVVLLGVAGRFLL